MKFKERVRYYLGEAQVNRGHKALATRLSKDLGKKITAKQVENYLDHKENTNTWKEIKKRAKSASDSGDYKWGTVYKILKRHFS